MSTPGEKAVALAQSLIRCPSVTPKDAGALDALIEPLKKARFICDRLTFTEADTPAIDNLVARIGDGPPQQMRMPTVKTPVDPGSKPPMEEKK